MIVVQCGFYKRTDSQSKHVDMQFDRAKTKCIAENQNIGYRWLVGRKVRGCTRQALAARKILWKNDGVTAKQDGCRSGKRLSRRHVVF